MKPDLVVSEGMIPLIVKGLRVHGGREEMMQADRLANWRDESQEGKSRAVAVDQLPGSWTS